MNQTIQNKAKSFFEDNEFKVFLNNFHKFSVQRDIALDSILYKLCKNNDLTLVLLTQPNAYLDIYDKTNGIYMLPKYSGKHFNRQQSRILCDLINQNTLQYGVENNLLTISGSENYFGEGDITVTAIDNQGGSDIETFEVSINSINDIPTVNDLDLEVIEDGIVILFHNSRISNT